MKVLDLLENWSVPKEIEEWGSESDFPAWRAYIAKEIHPDVMAVLFRLMFPVFWEVNGCVLMPLDADMDLALEGLSESIGRHNWPPSKFESTYNSVKMYDLFAHADVKYETSFEQAAALLKCSWELSLQSQYPDKKFKVEISNTESDYGPTLIFYSVAD